MKCWWVAVTSFMIFAGRSFQNLVNTISYFWSLSMCKFTFALRVCHANFLCSTLLEDGLYYLRWVLHFSFKGTDQTKLAILFVNILGQLCIVLCGRNTRTPIRNFAQI